MPRYSRRAIDFQCDHAPRICNSNCGGLLDSLYPARIHVFCQHEVQCTPVCQTLGMVACGTCSKCIVVNNILASRVWLQKLLAHAQCEPMSLPLQAVVVHGPRKWAAIAPAVPHRSDQQCRERWLNVLDPSLRLCAWEPGEDAALRGAVAACTKPDGKIGCAQAQVALSLGCSRTFQPCILAGFVHLIEF